MKEFDVVIIGAGISGLTAANYLKDSGLSFHIFEAENEVGGRVRCIRENGFIMDRGFQVFLPAYPEAKKLLDIEALNLKYFWNGACIIGDGRPFFIIDPLEKPKYLLSSIFETRIGLRDKMRLFHLRNTLKKRELTEILKDREISTRQELIKRKYSIELIGDFFQPFLSGIFLEKNLDTSSAMFDFVVKMFNEGGAALPAKGISEIPDQLYKNLPIDSVTFKTRVSAVNGNLISLESGETCIGKNIILAVEGNSTLLNGIDNNVNSTFVSVQNFYFELDQAPIKEPFLILNADANSIINNLCFVSRIAPDYAPLGKEILSVTVLENQKIDSETVKKELFKLFGTEVAKWSFVRKIDIPYALPAQNRIKSERSENEIRIKENMYLAGDFNLYGSLNAAMQSGREAAELLLKNLRISDS